MFKGRHFDKSVILLCVRWYLAYNLSLRNLKEMMAERGIDLDHSTVHRWVICFSPKLLERSVRSRANGTLMKPILRSKARGCTYIVPSIAMAIRLSSISANIVI